MKEVDKRIFVYAHWIGMKEPLLMGVLHAQQLRGKEVFSFEYQKDWLNSEYSLQLDPDLGLYSGPQYINDDKPNFGMFLDSAPDRWGQMLMRRREAALARKEKRQEQSLFQTDYLLGVYDGHRMGGLRFKVEPEGPFLNDNKEMAAPPWSSIRKLEQISLRLEEEDAINDPEYLEWLNLLVAPGSSLGGARPKASILDTENQLWIAKFPSKNDDFNSGAWEIVTYEMAIKAGIKMAESEARKFAGRHHTFLTKRFDRIENEVRIHFASAMTLLGFRDGQNHQQGLSYLDIVEFIMSQGAKVNEDLEELWRRIVFSISVSNTDDHLRNHGFIFTEKGWILSPAYDINPVEKGTGLSLNINENDNSLSLELAMSVHQYFRLSEERAEEIIAEVKSAVSNWRELAKKYGISNSEQELKAQAFSAIS
jgi:serine/threonine-protein kinase HipA